MRLAQFIERSREAILAESTTYAAQIPALKAAPPAILRDHMPLVLDSVVLDLKKSQSRAESIDKSRGEAPANATETAAETHGVLRARSGLDIEQLVAEYRVLRSCVLRLWAEGRESDVGVAEDTMRFNEAIDQAIAESVRFYNTEIVKWREIFLAVLGHDLRNPLNAIVLTAQVLATKANETTERDINALLRNSRRMGVLLESLLEYNKSALGIAMHVDREPVDLGPQCREEVEMLRRAFPSKQIEFSLKGDAQGTFDNSRIREALSNLVSNAAQHSPDGAVVTVAVEGREADVEISTENIAADIPVNDLNALFEPLRRRPDEANAVTKNLGLGLFIVRQIARAHGGEVTASPVGGRLRFSIVIPKH